MEQDTDVIRTLKDAVSSVLDEVRKVPPMHQSVSMPSPPAPQPAPPWHVWICATGAIVGVLVAIGAAWVAFDTKSEMRALRVEMANAREAAQVRHEDDVRELRQADRSFMAYIQTGRVPVLAQDERKKSP